MSVTTIRVNSSSELSAAINTLSDGEGGTILVENVNEVYAVSKYRAGTDAGDIVIQAADPEDPPTFAQVKLIESTNITFSDLAFDRTQSALEGKDLEVLRSSNITFKDSTFVNASDGFYTGGEDGVVMGGSVALFRDSSNITFTGNDVSQYGQGVAVIDSTGTIISENMFSQMTGDGVRMAGFRTP